MEVAAIAICMGAAIWWYRPKKWRVSTYEEAFPLHLESVEETEENKAQRVVVVQTPEGSVKMRRNDADFEYWAPRAVAYRYLEPVARKHVLLYGGSYVELKPATVKHVRIVEAASVFAALKGTQVVKKIVYKDINKYKYLGKEELVVEKIQGRAMSFADFKNKTV